MSEQDREYEESAAATEVGRKDDSTGEYMEKEPMSPPKIKEHEPTAVKRNPSNQRIVEQGSKGTESEEAKEEYRKKGMTKV
jgi:hypothetical protein